MKQKSDNAKSEIANKSGALPRAVLKGLVGGARINDRHEVTPEAAAALTAGGHEPGALGFGGFEPAKSFPPSAESAAGPAKAKIEFALASSNIHHGEHGAFTLKLDMQVTKQEDSHFLAANLELSATGIKSQPDSVKVTVVNQDTKDRIEYSAKDIDAHAKAGDPLFKNLSETVKKIVAATPEKDGDLTKEIEKKFSGKVTKIGHDNASVNPDDYKVEAKRDPAKESKLPGQSAAISKIIETKGGKILQDVGDTASKAVTKQLGNYHESNSRDAVAGGVDQTALRDGNKTKITTAMAQGGTGSYAGSASAGAEWGVKAEAGKEVSTTIARGYETTKTLTNEAYAIKVAADFAKFPADFAELRAQQNNFRVLGGDEAAAALTAGGHEPGALGFGGFEPAKSFPPSAGSAAEPAKPAKAKIEFALASSNIHRGEHGVFTLKVDMQVQETKQEGSHGPAAKLELNATVIKGQPDSAKVTVVNQDTKDRTEYSAKDIDAHAKAGDPLFKGISAMLKKILAAEHEEVTVPKDAARQAALEAQRGVTDANSWTEYVKKLTDGGLVQLDAAQKIAAAKEQVDAAKQVLAKADAGKPDASTAAQHDADARERSEFNTTPFNPADYHESNSRGVEASGYRYGGIDAQAVVTFHADFIHADFIHAEIEKRAAVETAIIPNEAYDAIKAAAFLEKVQTNITKHHNAEIEKRAVVKTANVPLE